MSGEFGDCNRRLTERDKSREQRRLGHSLGPLAEASAEFVKSSENLKV